MKTISTRFFFFLLTICMAGKPVLSQEDSSRLQQLSLRDLLNVKITTAGRISQSSELASAVVTVISREQIRARGYQSLLDVLYDLTDVKVDDKMYSGMRNSFTIRGTQGSEKFIILLDGIAITTPSGEAMPVMQNYPVHIAEQIEVLYGPASALYGANAMSGVINIITKKPSKKDLVTEISTTGGDNGYTNTTLFMAARLGKQVNLVASGQYFYDRSPDYSKIYRSDTLLGMSSHTTGTFHSIYGDFTPQAPVAPKYEAPMEAYNTFISLQAENFNFSFFRNYFKTPNSFENTPSNSIYNKDVASRQTITVANAAYKKTFDRLVSTTTIANSWYNMDPRSNYRNLYSAMERAYKYSAVTMAKLEQQVDYKVSGKLSFTTGIGYEHYAALPQSADLEAPVDKNKAAGGIYLGTRSYYKPEGLSAQFYFIKFNNTGLYFQARYTPAPRVNVTVGARYDDNSRYGSSLNPRLGVVAELSDNTTLKLLYGSSFRAPSPSDSYVQYGSFVTYDSGRNYQSHFLHLPNPGLKPVRSYNGEINLFQRLSDNVLLKADVYYTVLTGLYNFANDNLTTKLYNNVFNGMHVDYIQVFVNSQRQKNYGGSIQLNWKNTFGDVYLNSFASVSYVNGTINPGADENGIASKDMQTEFISPFMARIGTDLRVGEFSFSPRLIIAGRQRIAGIASDAAKVMRRQTIDGYSLLNISMRYNFSKQVSGFVNVNNALDQRYRSVSFNMDLDKKPTDTYYGNPQDPLRIMAGINFSFEKRHK
jgi:outer membrane receptor protein involved in Fe transport